MKIELNEKPVHTLGRTLIGSVIMLEGCDSLFMITTLRNDSGHQGIVNLANGYVIFKPLSTSVRSVDATLVVR